MFEIIVDLDSVSSVYASDSGKKLYNTIKNIMNLNSEIDIRVRIVSKLSYNSDANTPKIDEFVLPLNPLDFAVYKISEEVVDYIIKLDNDGITNRILLTAEVESTAITSIDDGRISFLFMADVISGWVANKLNNFIVKGQR